MSSQEGNEEEAWRGAGDQLTEIFLSDQPVSNQTNIASCGDYLAKCYFGQRETPQLKGCLFKSLHHSGLPSEFLQYPYYHATDKRSQHILAGMNDHSSGVLMKMQFIINNLKDCHGIWPQLFLQNLNAIIVNADHDTIRKILCQDNFAVLEELISYYTKDTKCELVFRYWCLFYNAFKEGLIPVLPSTLKEKLMEQFQKDFALAAQSLCRCKIEDQCNGQCEPNEEHRAIHSQLHMKITSVLMYYLICKIGNHSENPSDIFNERASNMNADKFIKGSVVLQYIKLFDAWNKFQSFGDILMMEILSHILIAFHSIPSEKNVFYSAIDLMLDMGCLSAALMLKDTLLALLEKEAAAPFQKGSKLVFVDPEIHIIFETMGVCGVVRCLNSFISNVEYPILSREEQTFLLDKIVILQKYMGETTGWSRDFESMYLYCRDLQRTLEQQLGFHMAGIKVESDTDTTNDMNETSKCLENAKSPKSSQTSQSDCHQTSKLSTAVDANAEAPDDWEVDARSVSKLRKAYEHELSHDDANDEPNFALKMLLITMDCFWGCRRCKRCFFPD